MNPYLANILGAITPSAEMTSINPVTGVAEDTLADQIAKPKVIHTERMAVQDRKVTDTPANPDATEDIRIMPTPAEKLDLYTKGTIYAFKASTSLTNGFLANSSYKMKARNAEFQAKQNIRSAEILLKNQREVTRAAQADATVYKMQGAQVKSAQKTAMAATGFAVGKGVYKNTLDTTDARTNYNASAIILKSELQNAELTRQAGEYRAQAEIEKGNAKIAKLQGRSEIWKGVAEALVYGTASAANFYVGKYGIKA